MGCVAPSPVACSCRACRSTRVAWTHPGGGPDFLHMLLDGYDQDAETSIAAVDESLAARDYPRVHEALHALRGYAVEVGASAAWSISSTGSGRSRPSSCRNLAPGPCWRDCARPSA
jgi:hypothetical protein